MKIQPRLGALTESQVRFLRGVIAEVMVASADQWMETVMQFVYDCRYSFLANYTPMISANRRIIGDHVAPDGQWSEYRGGGAVENFDGSGSYTVMNDGTTHGNSGVRPLLGDCKSPSWYEEELVPDKIWVSVECEDMRGGTNPEIASISDELHHMPDVQGRTRPTVVYATGTKEEVIRWCLRRCDLLDQLHQGGHLYWMGCRVEPDRNIYTARVRAVLAVMAAHYGISL